MQYASPEAAIQGIKKVLQKLPTEWEDEVFPALGLMWIPWDGDVDLGEMPDDEDAAIKHIKRLRLKAFEHGMKSSNGAVMRVFEGFEEKYLAEKEMDGIVINIVPAEVPDKIPAWMVEAAK